MIPIYFVNIARKTFYRPVAEVFFNKSWNRKNLLIMAGAICLPGFDTSVASCSMPMSGDFIS